MRILIIDDEPLILRVLQRALRSTHHVEVAGSASVAFTKLAAEDFDVIVCDVHMPDMDGPAFVAKLSPLDAARVIFTTGGAIAASDDEFNHSHRVLLKPFTALQLAGAMDAVVRDAA